MAKFIMKKAKMKELFLRLCGKNLSIRQYNQLSKEFDKRIYRFLKMAAKGLTIDTITLILNREFSHLRRENIYLFLKTLALRNKLQKKTEKRQTVPKEGNEELYIMYYKILIDDKLDKKEFDVELKKLTKELNKLTKKKNNYKKGIKRKGVTITNE